MRLSAFLFFVSIKQRLGHPTTAAQDKNFFSQIFFISEHELVIQNFHSCQPTLWSMLKLDLEYLASALSGRFKGGGGN